MTQPADRVFDQRNIPELTSALQKIIKAEGLDKIARKGAHSTEEVRRELGLPPG